MEVDTDPPGDFATEVKRLLLPIPFTVLTLTPEDLFASKLHALLCRQWQQRVKGRDWYDYYWYISRNISVNLKHLKSRLTQSGHWKISQELTHQQLLDLLHHKIQSVDFDAAKLDVVNFIKDKSAINLWSKEFFYELTKKLRAVRSED
jgi:hypothetical protein